MITHAGPGLIGVLAPGPASLAAEAKKKLSGLTSASTRTPNSGVAPRCLGPVKRVVRFLKNGAQMQLFPGLQSRSTACLASLFSISSFT